jgi:hypothetical protein
MRVTKMPPAIINPENADAPSVTPVPTIPGIVSTHAAIHALRYNKLALTRFAGVSLGDRITELLVPDLAVCVAALAPTRGGGDCAAAGRQ